jgi:molecular chaperone DnaK
MMSDQIFGIDLGTTNTALSYLYMIDKRASVRLLKNRDGKELTPSVVYFQPNSDDSIVGTTALDKYIEDPDRTFRWVKREMGNSPDWTISAGTEPLKINPETISARILKFVCEDAEKNLELEAPISNVVITVPAYFGDAQKRATLDAAEIAGLKASLIEEPTAAILDYILNLRQEGRLRNVFNEDRSTVAVFDLGGGTFDLSVCEVIFNKRSNGLPEILVIAKDGDPRLGGFDFDLALAKVALKKAIRQSPTNENLKVLDDSFEELRNESRITDRGLRDVVAELVHTAEQCKELLSHHESIDFRIPRFRNVVASVQISRKEFEDSIDEYIERIKEVISRTITQARSTTGGELDSWSKVDKVILIGGSTRIPAIARLVKSTFQVTPSRGADVDAAVAKGAAIKGALDSGHLVLGGLQMTTSHAYGVLNESGHMTTIIVPEGSKYPHEYRHKYEVPFSLDVNLPLRIGQRYLGSTKQIALKEFHHPFLYTGDQLDISITVDANGMLHFKTVEPNSGECLEESILEGIGMSQGDKDKQSRVVGHK